MDTHKAIAQPRVLIVDDDRAQRELLFAAMKKAGYRADVAADGTGALKFARNARYDLALLDFQMPDLNGVELFTKLHESQPWLRGIIITAYGSLRTVYPAINVGVTRVLPKPVNLPELLEVVDGELASADAGD